MPAICARLASTITWAMIAPQPDIQPTCGPNARAPHVKLVPQSGMRELSARYAYEIKKIGMKASSMTSGAFTPTSEETRPMDAARLYAGAVEAMPITTLAARPRAPVLRPLPPGCLVASASGAVGVEVVIRGHPRCESEVRYGPFPWG